ncbi:MAG: hypothetical protein QW373_01990 [Desulfurococcaceae archaeon]
MAKKKREEEEPDDILGVDFEPEEDEDEEFWEGLGDDITAAQKKAIELLARPRGMTKYTLSDLSSGEVKALSMLKALAEVIPDPILINYIRNYVVLKRSQARKGVKELIAVAGGRAWRILQNVSLSRLRRIHEREDEF